MNKNRILRNFFVMVFAITFILFSVFSGLNYAETQNISSDNITPPPDGNYTIEAVLKGGSGRVSIESPVRITVSSGNITATFIWTSSFYEYMLVEGQKYLPESRDKEKGTTTFRIPLKTIESFPFIAQTSKMSQPHDIEYSIVFNGDTLKNADSEGNQSVIRIIVALTSGLILLVLLLKIFRNGNKNHERKALLLLLIIGVLPITGCETGNHSDVKDKQSFIGADRLESENIAYAEGFQIDYYEKDISIIKIEGKNFVIIPRDLILMKESEKSSSDHPSTVYLTNHLKDAVIIKRPERVYLTAPSALALIHDIDAMSQIKYTGTKIESWSLDYAVDAMKSGKLVFAGKYSNPDYEKLLNEKCDLTVFSTMLNHSPEVGEKFTELGIPVFVDYSSYETHPLGRTEWIKVYGAILGKIEEAGRVFDEQKNIVESLTQNENDEEKKKTVALFTISPSGRISARRYDDYVSKMIDIAGGKYAYHHVTDVRFSAMNIIMEPEIFFQETAKADIIIYNATIHGGFDSIAAMTETHSILQDLPAIKSGDVWVTTKSFFQSSTSHGNMIIELNQIIKGEADENTELEFFKKLK